MLILFCDIVPKNAGYSLLYFTLFYILFLNLRTPKQTPSPLTLPSPPLAYAGRGETVVRYKLEVISYKLEVRS
jgi:hypothetical protein